ncbi:uncharacterized protein EI97DRAFT_145711 [Westerdykella ornata]|uniref:Uncharacterized protein n=1 Tax=Westerdykella ornata TaxID=318751 RepID=A0A6A6JC34_WESOR|nr:uncharacterized protein EI97DRAFT_145711 [Westerdykella ornata]KAF2273827.1 hypothetical protein EI97DRAFT_145711 [Westerdykella ornata]
MPVFGQCAYRARRPVKPHASRHNPGIISFKVHQPPCHPAPPTSSPHLPCDQKDTGEPIPAAPRYNDQWENKPMLEISRGSGTMTSPQLGVFLTVCCAIFTSQDPFLCFAAVSSWFVSPPNSGR